MMSSGRDPGPLAARADDGVSGRTQQFVLGDQAQGSRLSIPRVSNRHALLRGGQAGNPILWLIPITNVEEPLFYLFASVMAMLGLRLNLYSLTFIGCVLIGSSIVIVVTAMTKLKEVGNLEYMAGASTRTSFTFRFCPSLAEPRLLP